MFINLSTSALWDLATSNSIVRELRGKRSLVTWTVLLDQMIRARRLRSRHGVVVGGRFTRAWRMLSREAQNEVAAVTVGTTSLDVGLMIAATTSKNVNLVFEVALVNASVTIKTPAASA